MICLGDEFEGHLFGNHPPQGVVFGDDEGQLPVFDPVLHQQLGDVVSRASDVVIAAPLAAVDLEELVLAVPAVVLDVKVGEAGVMQLLQQLFDLQGKGSSYSVMMTAWLPMPWGECSSSSTWPRHISFTWPLRSE